MSPSRASVSVALATHNGAAYLEPQVRSILGQTSPVHEIVLADDASSDGSIALVERLVAEAGGAVRLVVLRSEAPLGVTRNFERAIAATTGEFVALCDQDDVWQPRKIEVLLRALKDAPGALLAHSDARLVDAGGAALEGSLFSRLEIASADLTALRGAGAFDLLLRRNLVTGATVLFRRSLFQRAEPFPAEWVHDEWLAILAAAYGGVAPSTEQLIDYRQHGRNQIGVRRPTLRAKVRQVLTPRGDRNRMLAVRSALLADRLAAATGEGVRAEDARRARAKAEFEQTRALFPDARLRRVRSVLRLARSGAYARYASQGSADILRDLMQPA